MDKPKSAIIVGAGAGGIASAARLAKAGFKVTVIEKNDHTGGRCSLIHDNGYRFDQGPSLLLLPDLFREVFTDLDTSLEAEGVELLKCEPNYNVWFGDGECIELSTDVTRMKKTIEKWEGKEGFERYLAWMREAHVHYEASVVHVLRKNFGTIWAMARPSFLPYLMALHPFESIWARASRYFLTERLRRAFTFGSMYMGMSPFEAPGTYSLLQYTELAEGIWYPRGGFHKVLDALVTIGERLGVEYRLSTPVAQVNIDRYSRRATGVTLASGEVLNADIVLVNADLVYAYNKLLPPSDRATSLSKKPASCSSISFYWSMDKVIPELHTHNVFLADDYQDSFDDIFKRQQIPKEPSFYVNVPSRVDPTAAPEGRDSVVVLVPCGHLLEGEADRGLNPQNAQDWQAMVAKARHAVFETIRLRTGADLQSHVVHEIVNTPGSWKERFNLDRGAILGLSHSFFNVLSFRPKTKHPDLGSLYFVGASTHPGTGVPIVLCGSKITTEQILDDLGMVKPWYPGGHKRRIVSDLDKEGWHPLDLGHTLVAILIALCLVLYMFAFT
ncbi:Phytoene desaturase [Cladophialophora carrionii]|uniref:Phytoene desaturase n=1 Tax=Cladophialophora carrionii TaxID=86049 RepID=A0A1C1CZD8_9EURO|nr:Phytoene desaturase [Cladophialophora carrionii]